MMNRRRLVQRRNLCRAGGSWISGAASERERERELASGAHSCYLEAIKRRARKDTEAVEMQLDTRTC